MMKPTYELKAVRRGRWWAVEVRELRHVHCQARRLDQAEALAREAIAVALQTPEDSFDVALHADLASMGGLQTPIERALQARKDSDAARDRAMSAMRDAVRQIRSAGYTSRDAGMLLGVSNQRISQIERAIAHDSPPGDAPDAAGREIAAPRG